MQVRQHQRVDLGGSPVRAAHVARRPGRPGPAAGLDGNRVTPEQIRLLQRSVGNQAIAALFAGEAASASPAIQRAISFDKGVTAQAAIPASVLGRATMLGPGTLALVRKWLSEPTVHEHADWDAVLAEAHKTAAAPAISWGDPMTFDADASDSDSETETDKRDQAMFGARTIVYSPHVFNYTKREGRRSSRGKWSTDREGDARVKPKVDNRARSPTETQNLAADAKTIHDEIPEFVMDRTGKRKANQSFGATTVVCAAFLHVDGTLRRMCASNADGPLAKPLREKAEELRYHVIRAEQAHAEGEMLQYLNQRAQVYSLFAMGCDKDHCAECNWAMTKVLGDYPTETAKSDKKYGKYYIPPSYARVLGQNYTSDNTPDAMKRHVKPPPRKRARPTPPATTPPGT